MIKVFSCAHVFLCFSRSIGLSDTVVTFCYILLFLLTAPLFMANKAYHNGLHRGHCGVATDGLPMIREEPKKQTLAALQEVTQRVGRKWGQIDAEVSRAWPWLWRPLRMTESQPSLCSWHCSSDGNRTETNDMNMQQHRTELYDS